MTERENLHKQIRLVQLMTDRLCSEADIAIDKDFHPGYPASCYTRTALTDRIRILRAELSRLSKLMEGYNAYDN